MKLTRVRCVIRSDEGLPHSAPTTASASADKSALIMVCNRLRIRSGDASVRASLSRPAGSTIVGAVIVLMPFEWVVGDSSKDHTVTASMF
jgi:hypothetical protein